MNKIMFDILMYLNDNTGWDSRAAARKLYKPYSVIDAEFERLNEEGYAKGGIITEKGVQYLERHKVDNAIILAAGVSSRFVPLCFERPKGLLPVNGEVLIERQIRQLHEKGITDITIVVGFMKDKFYYLQEKYGVNIIEIGRGNNRIAQLFPCRPYRDRRLSY